jgi:Mlc titration factor MtfA (ptsG expression regulator)
LEWLIGLVLALVLMVWLYRRAAQRHRSALLNAPIDAATLETIARSVPHFSQMPADRQEHLSHLAVAIASEKSFIGCAGFTVDDAVRFTIASQAALAVLELGLEAYDGVDRILVYPEPFLVELEHEAGGIHTLEENAVLSGEASDLGTVVLAWSDVAFGARRESDGFNVVIHEFAHQLDWTTGEISGTPDLGEGDYEVWGRVMRHAWHRLEQEAKHHDHHPGLDLYALTDAGEFFAVASEAFFERPAHLRAWDRALYDQLKSYYRLDPASWSAGV